MYGPVSGWEYRCGLQFRGGWCTDSVREPVCWLDSAARRAKGRHGRRAVAGGAGARWSAPLRVPLPPLGCTRWACADGCGHSGSPSFRTQAQGCGQHNHFRLATSWGRLYYGVRRLACASKAVASHRTPQNALSPPIAATFIFCYDLLRTLLLSPAQRQLVRPRIA